MQHCENCHTQFQWKKVYRYLWGPIIKPFRCHACNQEHLITMKARFMLSLLYLPTTLFLLFLPPFQNILLNLGIGILLLLISSLLSPFVVRFKLDYTNESRF
ncbi:TIGR04104 family putative zinc finger protein [Rossellomorea sp. SC111]|uniref:TIGR04104 family putative zinc finger protein n=1 Tax=Rossellomorea sp. SC111 TaxID=2968985 RepID=UPI0035C77490